MTDALVLSASTFNTVRRDDVQPLVALAHDDPRQLVHGGGPVHKDGVLVVDHVVGDLRDRPLFIQVPLASDQLRRGDLDAHRVRGDRAAVDTLQAVLLRQQFEIPADRHLADVHQLAEFRDPHGPPFIDQIAYALKALVGKHGHPLSPTTTGSRRHRACRPGRRPVHRRRTAASPYSRSGP